MSRNSWLTILVCALVLLCSQALLAATQNAVVYGTVYDASGNPMAGVTVTLENPLFGFSRTTTTASDGSYNFAEVPPASDYKVTATLNGRTVDVRGGIAVNVGDERVILPPLKEQVAAPAPTPGAAPAPTPAAAEGPAITPEFPSTSIGGVITRDQMLSLPLYNRNFLALGLLTPNVHDVPEGSALAGASFSVAGNREDANNFLLDGADNVASSSNQAIPFQVNDSIQEFRLVSSDASAEYGRNQGGVVNVVTRRATNNWHGSAYGYFGNDAFNADSPLSVYSNTTFAKAAAYAGPVTAPIALPTPIPFFPFFLPAQPTSYNQYVNTAAAAGWCTDSIGLPGSTVPCATGGFGANNHFDPASLLATHDSHTIPFDSKQFGFNAGGPLKKDKVFLFGSFEGTLINNPNPIFERVPSAFDRTYGALNSRDPVDYGTPLFLPTSPDFQVARNVLALFPNANVVGVPDALEFFQGEAPNYTNVYNGLLRLDWMQSERTTWSFRYVVQLLDQLHDDSLPPSALGTGYPGNGAYRDALNHNFNASFSHTFSPTLLNEFHAGFNRFNLNETAQDNKFNASALGLNSGSVPTFFLSGLDTQYSGAQTSNFATAACVLTPSTCMGAYGGWFDQFWQSVFGVGFSPAPMMPTLDGLFPMARIGAPLGVPSQRTDTTAFAGDTLSWTHGKHSFKFGGEYRHLNNNFFDGSFARGFVVSSDLGEFTSDSETCNFPTFACAFGLFFQPAFTFPSFDYAQKQHSPYQGVFNSQGISGFVQDTWRATRRITLNLGVRYEYFSVPTEENNQIWNYDPVAHGLVQQNGAAVFDPFGNQCSGLPPTLYLNTGAPPAALTSPFFQLWNCNFTGSHTIAHNNTHDFAPRVGLAWDIFGTGRTIFRGGFGMYYDQLPIVDTANLMYNRPTTFSLTNPQAFYGQGFFQSVPYCAFQCGQGNSILNLAASPSFVSIAQSAASPFGMLARDVAHSDTPFTMQFNATVQQQLGNHAVLEAGYVGSRGYNLPVVYDSNFNDEWFCTSSAAINPAFPCDTNAFFPVFTLTNRGSSNYDSVMARVRLGRWHGLTANATYVYSRSHDNDSNALFPLLPTTLANFIQQIEFQGTGNPGVFCYGGVNFSSVPGVPCPLVQGGGVSGGLALTTTGAGAVNVSRYLIPQDPNNFLHDEWGPSDFNVPHRFVLDYVWEIPGKGALRGDWMFSGIFIAQSGQPFTIFAGPAFGQVDQRVDVTGAVSQNNGDPTAAILPTNLALPGPTCHATTGTPFVASGVPFSGVAGSPCIGNSRRNQFTGPNFFTWNMAVQKGFHVFGEGRMLFLRAEFYNLTDRANFYNPISQLSLDGINLNPQFGQILSAKDPRQIQFAVRFNF